VTSRLDPEKSHHIAPEGIALSAGIKSFQSKYFLKLRHPANHKHGEALDQEKKGRSRKTVTLSFLWGAMVSSYMIRYAMGVIAPTLMQLYHISPRTMGYVLSGWNWSYTPSQLFIGPLIDRFGPWLVMGVGSAVWSLSTLALPIATTVVALFLMRIIFGFGTSVLLPSTVTAVSREFTFKERTRAIAVAFSGNQAGLAAGATVAAIILSWWGWQAVFYCLGGVSLLLVLGWFFLYPDREIGRRSAENDIGGTSHDQKGIVLCSLLRRRSTWGLAIGQMGYLYAYFFFVSWLPGYLILDRKMTLLKSGFIGALPFWVGVLATLGGGWLGDYLIARGATITFSRKSILGTGLAGATVMIFGVTLVKQDWLAVTLLILAMASLRMTTGSSNSLPIDLVPVSQVGSLAAIQDLFGSFGGLLAPIVTGYIVSSTGSFFGSFMVAGGMTLMAAFSFVFLTGNLDARSQK
jgi:MFS transporter, ACS family, D-galactonate transporter